MVNALVGNQSGRDSGGELTPASSIPGTPALAGHTINLPAHSALSLSGSGRVSRQSDFASDRASLPVNLGGSTNSATDHVIER